MDKQYLFSEKELHDIISGYYCFSGQPISKWTGDLLKDKQPVEILNKQEVKNIIYKLTDDYEIQEGINTKELLLVGKEIDEFITTICNLAK